VLIIEPRVFGDERGFFMESFNQKAFNDATGLDVSFVQDNYSRSSGGVLRGLHYQLPPHAQAKLVRVVRGAVLDVAVDIRKCSPNFGRWVAVELSDSNHKQLWIPTGFAHGFLVLSDSAEVFYKVSAYYSSEYERSVVWNDPTLNVTWGINGNPILSAKDARAPTLSNCELPSI
jgi:dTDP-4-dehydrorhamnose 3,5-epimerase